MNNLIQLVRRPVPVLLVAAVVGGLVALGLGLRQPVRYQTSISFAANRLNKTSSTEYQYDGYYAIQAADLFSQTVVSWFSTPSVLIEVYDRAGLKSSPDSLTSLSRRFKTKKYAAQNIVVTFSEESRERAEKVAAAVTVTMQERAASLNQTADRQAFFEIVGSTPVIVEAKANLPVQTLAGLVAGFLVALALLSLVAYVKALPADSGYAHRS